MSGNLLNRVAAAALSALAASVGGSGAALAAPTIHNLGLLPDLFPEFPFDSSEAHGVSADGSTATGLCRNGSEGFDRAIRWTKNGGMEDLGTLNGPTRGTALNANGTVVVGHTTGIGFNAFRWTTGGGMENLGSLGGGQSLAQGVSADGAVVVGYSQTSDGLVRAFQWTSDGGMEEVGPLPPGRDLSYAVAISGDGSVVAGTSESPLPARAVIWRDGGVQDLGVLPGFSNSQARALSADGLVAAGVSYTSAFTSGRAFRWSDADGMVDLGVLPGAPGADAFAVNGDGSVIVGASGGRAFMWTDDLGMVDLYGHLSTLGADLTGWFLHNATGISADGSVIAGIGFFNGERRAFVAVLPAPVGILGVGITTTSQVNAGPTEVRTDTVIDPGVEIQFGDAADFAWMVAGDSINVEPHPNPSAPWRYEILFGATHTFVEGDLLNLSFTLPYPLVYGAAAITVAETVTLINGVNNGNTLAFRFKNMIEVSQGDFGGRVQIVFEVIECPSDLNGDGVTNAADLAIVLGAWGAAHPTADLDGDGSVGAGDLAQLLGSWGDC